MATDAANDDAPRAKAVMTARVFKVDMTFLQILLEFRSPRGTHNNADPNCVFRLLGKIEARLVMDMDLIMASDGLAMAGLGPTIGTPMGIA
jgi:hypothetical protein